MEIMLLYYTSTGVNMKYFLYYIVDEINFYLDLIF